MSEVTTPADSLVTSPTGYTISTSGSWSFGRRTTAQTSSQPTDMAASTTATGSNGNINLVHLVADIQSMTNRMSRFPNVFEGSGEGSTDNDDDTMSNETAGGHLHSTLVRIGESDETGTPFSNMMDGDLGLSDGSFGSSGNRQLRSSTRATLSLPSLSSESNRSGSRAAGSTDNPLRDLRLTFATASSPPHQITEGTNTSPTD